MELDYKAIGKRIKIARIRAEISQEQLSIRELRMQASGTSEIFARPIFQDFTDRSLLQSFLCGT